MYTPAKQRLVKNSVGVRCFPLEVFHIVISHTLASFEVTFT